MTNPADAPRKECTPCRNGQHCHGKGWEGCQCVVCGGFPAVYAPIAADAQRAQAREIAEKAARDCTGVYTHEVVAVIEAAIIEATAALREENARLVRELDEAHAAFSTERGSAYKLSTRITALTTERDTLREALQEIADSIPERYHHNSDIATAAVQTARAALKEPR